MLHLHCHACRGVPHTAPRPFFIQNAFGRLVEQSTLLWRLPRLVRVVRQLRSNCGRLSQAQLCSRPPPPTWLSRRSRKHIFRGTEIVARLEGTEGTTGVVAVGIGAAAIRPGAAAFVPQSTSSLSTNVAAAPAFVPSALSPGLGSSIRPHLRRCCRRFVKAHARSPEKSSRTQALDIFRWKVQGKSQQLNRTLPLQQSSVAACRRQRRHALKAEGIQPSLLFSPHQPTRLPPKLKLS